MPESSGHKPGLVETEVMPLHEGSGAFYLHEWSEVKFPANLKFHIFAISPQVFHLTLKN